MNNRPSQPLSPEAAAVRSLRKVVVVWLTLLSLLLLGGGVWEDYRSCQRQEPVRALSVSRSLQLKAAWYEDAQRAQDYAKIDPNTAGQAVNADFASSRRALADAVRAAPPIDCGTFPPGK